MKTAAADTRMIALAQLRVAPWNARKTFDLETMAALTASIKLHGAQVPLIVRPGEATSLKKDGDDVKMVFQPAYEIVAGHRRFKAAAILKLAELPCSVRELTDAEAREIALIDNLQREGLPALEEADGFADLMDQLGSIAQVAARVGKEQGYVAKSLKLRTLTTWSRDALREKLITIDHALLLARLAEAEQNQALKWCLDHTAGVKVGVEKVIQDNLARRKDSREEDDLTEGAGKTTPALRPHLRQEWEPQSVLRLKEHIECETGTPLDRAPWPMDEDYLLPDAGSCLDCPKNTKANAPLFGDLDMGVAVCTDGVCFRDKTTAFVQLQGRDEAKRTAQKLGKPPVPGAFEPLRVSWKATSTPPRLDKETGAPTLKQVFKDGQWEQATKKCEYAVAAVTVDWRDASGFHNRTTPRKPGEIVQACIEPKCKVHPKGWAAPKSARGSGGQESWEEGRAREQKALEAYQAKELPVRRALYDAIVAKMAPVQMRRQVLREEVNSSQLCRGLGCHTENWQENVRAANALLQKAADGELDILLFHSAFGEELRIHTDESRQKDKGRGKLRDLAKAAGVDAAAIERKFDAPAKPKAQAKLAKAVKPAAKTAAKKKPAKKAAKRGGRK